jgi:hypothetical protein
MPPRYAYWTILIDNAPTAFRAADRDDLLPTLHQLRRKNADVAMKWFARGRLWESPEAAQEAARVKAAREKRGRDWRPGGAHKDPRARFDKEARRQGKRDLRRERGLNAPPAESERRPPPPSGHRERRPWQSKSHGAQKPWRPKNAGGDRRPWRPPHHRGPKPPWRDGSKHKAFGGPKPGGRPETEGSRRDEDEKKTKS